MPVLIDKLHWFPQTTPTGLRKALEKRCWYSVLAGTITTPPPVNYQIGLVLGCVKLRQFRVGVAFRSMTPSMGAGGPWNPQFQTARTKLFFVESGGGENKIRYTKLSEYTQPETAGKLPLMNQSPDSFLNLNALQLLIAETSWGLPQVCAWENRPGIWMEN